MWFERQQHYRFPVSLVENTREYKWVEWAVDSLQTAKIKEG